jgi:hypothetical protein
MLGEHRNQFSLTRAALSTRGAQKQIPISNYLHMTVIVEGPISVFQGRPQIVIKTLTDIKLSHTLPLSKPEPAAASGPGSSR